MMYLCNNEVVIILTRIHISNVAHLSWTVKPLCLHCKKGWNYQKYPRRRM